MLSEFTLSSTVNDREPRYPIFANSKINLSRYRKNIAGFTFFLLVVCLLLGSTLFYLPASLSKVTHITGLLLMGYLHVLFIDAYLARLALLARWIYTLLLCVVILGVFVALRMYTNSFHWTTAASPACAFVLPLVIAELWWMYSGTHSVEMKVWSLTSDLPMQKSTTFLNSIPVRIKLLQENRSAQLISFRAPVRMQLGLIFYHMAQEKNAAGQTAIKFVDKKKEPLRWVFYTSSFGRVKYLDPETGLLENGVKSNGVVVIKQLTT